MITLLAKPLIAQGRVLVPTGSPIVIDSDYLNIKRAVVEECAVRNWSVSSQSAKLRRQVAGEPPFAVAKSEGGMLLGLWRVGGGVGRLILLTGGNNFVEWGPGCGMVVEYSLPEQGHRVAVFAGHASFNLGTFASEAQAKAVRALWLDAILNTPYGGLLRYDDATESVVDELAEGEDAFDEIALMPPPKELLEHVAEEVRKTLCFTPGKIQIVPPDGPPRVQPPLIECPENEHWRICPHCGEEKMAFDRVRTLWRCIRCGKQAKP